jgi:hypothetical protein
LSANASEIDSIRSSKDPAMVWRSGIGGSLGTSRFLIVGLGS